MPEPQVHTCHEFCPCQTGGEPMGDFIGDAFRVEPPRCVACDEPFVNGDKIREVGMGDEIEIIHDRCKAAYKAKVA